MVVVVVSAVVIATVSVESGVAVGVVAKVMATSAALLLDFPGDDFAPAVAHFAAGSGAGDFDGVFE